MVLKLTREVYAIAHIPAILTLQIAGYGGRNLFLIAFLIVICQSSDVMQYLWGKAAGRHPIAPRISPAKTVEGTLGGIACASCRRRDQQRISMSSSVSLLVGGR